MELCQLVDDGGRVLYLVLVEEFFQKGFAFLLQLTVLAAQDGLDFAFCLCRTDEVYPGRLYVLRLGREDFHLVAAVQLVAQGYQLVVDLGANAM